jgi:hypothetical protein
LGIARAADPAVVRPDEGRLQLYEPISAGYTKDSDDVPFLDVTLSLKFRLAPEFVQDRNYRLFLAFTTRFGFYLGTRESSPVIGKTYNPKLIWRYIPESGTRASSVGRANSVERRGYLDLAYAHESNGQSINTPEEYEAAQRTAERPNFANDYLSRGWDYLEVVWKSSHGDRAQWASYVDLKYFLEHGLLQGAPEQYNSWENNPEGKPRKAVDGLSGTVEYDWPCTTATVSCALLSLKYSTGYDSPFEFSTVRAEAGVKVYGIPLALWAQRGYMSDLAMYYRKVTSFGAELRIAEF